MHHIYNWAALTHTDIHIINHMSCNIFIISTKICEIFQYWKSFGILPAGGSWNLTRKLNLKPIFCEIFDKSAGVNFPFCADTTLKLSSLIRRRAKTNLVLQRHTFDLLCCLQVAPSFSNEPCNCWSVIIAASSHKKIWICLIQKVSESRLIKLIISNQNFVSHRLKSNSLAGVM